MWQLDDVLSLHKKHPNTFEIPAQYLRENLKVGDYTKLRFLLPATDENGEYMKGERMWVKVIEVYPTDYIGVLDNDPVLQGIIVAGDMVRFGPHHIMDVHTS